MNLPLSKRPVIVAIAGPNGAGKTTFFHAHLRQAALRFLNADVVARELLLQPYESARLADALRQELVRQRESFAFETVFSDPAGDKLAFLAEASRLGYNVILCFIGIASVRVSVERVAMRLSQGGHDVPVEKLRSRFPRTLKNLERAIRELPQVRIFDNGDLEHPFRMIALFEAGRPVVLRPPIPRWLRPLLPGRSGATKPS